MAGAAKAKLLFAANVSLMVCISCASLLAEKGSYRHSIVAVESSDVKRRLAERLIFAPQAFKRITLMRGNVIGFIAFDFVLRLVFRGVMHMAFVVEVFGVNGDDRARNPARLGVPGYVISNFERSWHAPNPS
jgi:hypothetical protein